MKIKQLLAITFSLGLLCSCMSDYPRPEFEYFPQTPNPLKVLKEFRKNQIVSCTMAQNAVMEINNKSIAAIGLCAFNSEQGYIALSLISTTGIKLIEVAEFNGKRRAVFAISDISDENKAADRIADDVKRIYIHPTGNPAFYQVSDPKVTFIWLKDKVKNELSFGYDHKLKRTVLKEKKILIEDELVGSVFYYEHKIFNGKNVAMRIRYENYKYGYNLIIKNREVIEGVQSDKK